MFAFFSTVSTLTVVDFLTYLFQSRHKKKKKVFIYIQSFYELEKINLIYIISAGWLVNLENLKV